MAKDIYDDSIFPPHLGKYIIIGIVGIISLMFIWGSYFTVPAGHRGIIYSAVGGTKHVSYSEGIHFKTPFVDDAYTIEVRTKKYEIEAGSSSKDLQDVKTKVAVNYHTDPESSYKIFQNIGGDYESRVIAPSVSEVVKAVTAKYNAEELITKREVVKEDIKLALRERLLTYNMIMEDLSITNFDFSPEFNKAIENKVTQEQNAIAEKNKLESIKFQAQQAIEQAKGQAESIRVINQQLTTSPQYIQFKLVEKWDGKMPLSLGSGSLLSIASTQVQNTTV